MELLWEIPTLRIKILWTYEPEANILPSTIPKSQTDDKKKTQNPKLQEEIDVWQRFIAARLVFTDTIYNA
jgi:hypothetical protein